MQADDTLNGLYIIFFFVYFDLNGKQNKFRKKSCRFLRSGFMKNMITSLIL